MVMQSTPPVPPPGYGALCRALPVLCGLLASGPVLAAEFHFYYAGEAGGALLGARQGAAEARIQGRFLGQDYRLEKHPGEGTLPPQGIGIVAAVPAPALLALARAHPEVAVFNVAADDDALRQSCLPNLLHVLPSRRMKADAVAQWQALHPDAGVQAQAWHPAFVKFAARDLNKRFRKAHNTAMDDAAWAGWAAVRMSADLIARGDSQDAPGLLEQLRTALAFDGQKGEALNFRANGQLRQPLLLVNDGGLVGEAPVRGKDLDSLGARSACPSP